MNQKITKTMRSASLKDLDALVALENTCFDYDSLNKRSFKRWIQADHGILLVVEHKEQLVAYGLVWCHKGTRLARLYSIAVLPSMRGQGIAVDLLTALEEATAEKAKLFMRLEVAKHNKGAIALYESLGYKVFGEYYNYYEDHSDALRMQKTIQRIKEGQSKQITPWYAQTTDFTCGPAALMMAMASLSKKIKLDQALELDIWREATTIFMTSGQGGCHPLGLALAAQQRGFKVCVYLNTREPLFVDGVRSQHKKQIMASVHSQFKKKVSQREDIDVVYKDITQQKITQWLREGFAVIMLISTYRLDGKKSSHWVTLTNIDDDCLYVHDPDPDELNQLAIDCQNLPIARDDFEKMSAFGSGRLRTALAIKHTEKN